MNASPTHPRPMTPIHQAAARGFEAAADTYVRGRPDYPDALLGWFQDALALAPGRHAVDVGAGTGKCTALLARTGAELIAIEPVDAMRARLAAALPDVDARRGTAEAMPLPDGAADAVVCAQAFHWFANADALREMHRVLAPHGVLGLVWNVRDSSVDWVAELTDIISPYEGDAPRYHSGAWRHAFDGRWFEPPAVTVFTHEHVGSPEEVVVQRFMSVSFIAALPGPEQARVEGRLRALVRTHPALRDRDTVAFPYRTEAWRCARRAG